MVCLNKSLNLFTPLLPPYLLASAQTHRGVPGRGGGRDGGATSARPHDFATLPVEHVLDWARVPN